MSLKALSLVIFFSSADSIQTFSLVRKLLGKSDVSEMKLLELEQFTPHNIVLRKLYFFAETLSTDS